MTPVLALVVQALIEHLHDFYKVVSNNTKSTIVKAMGSKTYWLYVSWAISFICVPDGPQGSFEVASLTFA